MSFVYRHQYFGEPHTSEKFVRCAYVFEKMPREGVRLSTNNEKQHCCNALDSPNCFVPSIIPQRIYSWLSKYGLYSQPCHRGFTMKITDSPNMIGTVNHATEGLQHRILGFSKHCSFHCYERAREDTDGGGNSTE